VEDDIERLAAEQHISTEAVNDRLDQIWQDLADDPDALEIVAGSENPFRAERREGQFGVGETIAIAVVGGIGKDIASSIWKDLVWPALRAYFGADLKKSDDAPAG